MTGLLQLVSDDRFETAGCQSLRPPRILGLVTHRSSKVHISRCNHHS